MYVIATFTCPNFRIFQFLSMSLFLNLLFETDSYSNEYLLAKFGFDTAENELSKVCRSKQAIPTPGHKSGSEYRAQQGRTFMR